MGGSERFMKILLLLTITFIMVSCGSETGDTSPGSESEDVMKIWSAAIAEQGSSDSLFFEGQLFSTYGIGGENTGFSLSMGGGKTIELDLVTNGLEKEYSEYLFVEVTGYFKEVEGVEIPTRTVFIVETIEEPDNPHIE
jgi:hypothetical protein